jgi:hypothetical protein
MVLASTLMLFYATDTAKAQKPNIAIVDVSLFTPRVISITPKLVHLQNGLPRSNGFHPKHPTVMPLFDLGKGRIDTFRSNRCPFCAHFSKPIIHQCFMPIQHGY